MLDTVDVIFAFAFNRFGEGRKIMFHRLNHVLMNMTRGLISQNILTSELGRAV